MKEGSIMFQIVSDGSCDLTEELLTIHQIHTVPFYITIGGKTHQKEREELSVKDFYQYMVDHPDVFPKTSMPSIEDYVNYFEDILKQGQDILCFTITTKFSGSYNSAINAKEILLEDYPDVKIEVIDATVNTVLQGMLVEEAVAKKNSGASFEETVAFINDIKSTGRIFFTIGSMDYLIHGGRVGKLSGIAAGALGIKPLILLKEGEIFNNGITRGRKKSKAKVMEQIINYLQEMNLNLNEYRFAVGFGYDKDEGQEFKEQFIEKLKTYDPNYECDIPLLQIGATIGVHTGPYPIGVGLLKKFKNKKSLFAQ